MAENVISARITARNETAGGVSAAKASIESLGTATRDIASKIKDGFASVGSSLGQTKSDASAAAGGFEAAEGRIGAAISRLKSTLSSMKTSFKEGFQEGSRQADAAAARTEAANNRIDRSARSAAGGFGFLKGAFAAVAVGAVARETIQTVASFEKLRAVLTTLEGSSGGGAARFAELKKFATETPFQLNEVVEAFSRLKSQGLDPSNSALRSYGNTAAAMGKTLGQMTEAVADASMGEFERLKEFGIKAVDAGDSVIFNFKGQATTIKKNSADIQAYLQQIGNVQFAGAMEQQMKTLGGAFSNVLDAAANFADGIGEGGLSSALKDAASEMTAASGTSSELANGLGAVLGTGVRAITDLVITCGQVFGSIFTTIKEVVGSSMGKSAADTLTFGNIMKAVQSVIVAFGSTIQTVFAIVGAIIRTAINLFGTLASAISNALRLNMSGFVDTVRNGVNTQIGIVSDARNRLVGIETRNRDKINNIWKAPLPAPALPKLSAGGIGAGSSFGKKAGGGGSAKSKGSGGSSGGAAAQGPSQIERWQAELTQMLDAEEDFARDDKKITLDFWTSKIEAARKNSKTLSAVTDQVARASRAVRKVELQDSLENMRNIAEMRADTARAETELADIALQRKLEDLNAEEQAGTISNVKAAQRRAVLNRELYQLDIDLEDKLFKLKLGQLQAGQRKYAAETQQFRQYARQIETLTAQHNQRVSIMSAQAAKRQSKDERDVMTARRQNFTNLANSWASSLAKMATLQQGFSATVNGIWQGLLGIIEQILTQMIAKFIMAMLIKIGLVKAEHAAGVGSQASLAGAGGVASMAAAPFPINLNAPAFGAAMYAASMAFGSMGFAAEHGYDVPALAGAGIDGRGGQVGIVHPREMVLPADLADNVRSGMGGGMNVQINAVDGQSVRRMLMANKKDVAGALRKHVRDGGR